MQKSRLAWGGLFLGGAIASFNLSDLPARLFNALAAEPTQLREDVAYGPLARQRLDIYEPTGARRRGLVVFFYGGGWTSGEKWMYRFVGAALAARGYRTVIPDYRLYPDVRFPAFMEDAALAYRWAAQAAGDEPIVLAGHSAGGHVAALLALDGRWIGEAPRPAGVVGLAGPYAFDPTTWPSTKDIFAPAAAHPDSARPVAFVTPQSPPMLLTRGAEDDVVAPYNAEELAKALTAAGVPVENKLYPGLGHVALILAFARPLRWRAPALEDALAFIGQVTGNITAPR